MGFSWLICIFIIIYWEGIKPLFCLTEPELITGSVFVPTNSPHAVPGYSSSSVSHVFFILAPPLPPIALLHLSILTWSQLPCFFLPLSNPPTHQHQHTHNQQTPSFDIDKWRLTEMTASLLMLRSDTTLDR